VDSAKGAVSGAWNWITGGGKGNALSEKNKADKSEAIKVSLDALGDKNQSLKDESESTVENKLKTANQQGGAQGVIDSISTTASYEEPGGEVVVVPSTKKGTDIDNITGATGGGAGSPLVLSGSGSGKDSYETLYKGS
jgi:hypothetical protein